MMHIDENTIVTIRYIMKNSENDVLENNMAGRPVVFLFGTNNISPILQSQLCGLSQGDKKTICLQKEQSAADDDYTFEVLIDEVRSALPEEILLGYPLLLNANDCEENCACHTSSTQLLAHNA